MVAKAHAPRNKEIARGVPARGRAGAAKKSGKWRFIKKGAEGKKTEGKAVAAEGSKQLARWYAAEDAKAHFKTGKSKQRPTKYRSTLAPGAVLIVLAGRFRGKRVVLLKTLDNGLLLVTGPYKVNGVPLRRVNARYVIATSTRIDISKVDLSAADEKIFEKKYEHPEGQEPSKDFFAIGNKKPVHDERVAAQKSIDDQLIPLIKAVPMLPQYLNAKFSLTANQFPHELKF